MFVKPLLLLTLLLAALWAPITPAPATVHFAPNTTIDQVQAVLASHKGQQGWFYLTYTNRAGETMHRAVQGLHAALTPTQPILAALTPAGPLLADRIELYNLSDAGRQALAASPLVERIDTVSQPAANAVFFLNLLTGRP